MVNKQNLNSTSCSPHDFTKSKWRIPNFTSTKRFVQSRTSLGFLLGFSHETNLIKKSEFVNLFGEQLTTKAPIIKKKTDEPAMFQNSLKCHFYVVFKSKSSLISPLKFFGHNNFLFVTYFCEKLINRESGLTNFDGHLSKGGSD